MYGILDYDGGFIHTSNTEKGAKQHATRNGYTVIYWCSPRSWAVCEWASKATGKWVNV